jgi:hypothetical protein
VGGSCGEKFKMICQWHGLACEVQVEFGTHDSRRSLISNLVEHGAPPHDWNSEHRCWICEKERVEARAKGWYQLDSHDGRVKPQVVIAKQRAERGQ